MRELASEPGDSDGAELEQLRRVHALGLVTASLMHDLNNLLTPMLGLTALLERQLEPDSRSLVLATELRSITERAALLARDILALGKNRPTAIEPVDVNRVIGEMRALIERFLGENVFLAVALDDACCEAELDRERFEHAILNLVVNAREAMPSGGMVTISTDRVRVDGLPGYVRVVVSDSGVGMSDEVRARAFEPFFTTRAKCGGTGLGLASVKRFVEDSGGLVSLHSTPGKGSQLVLCLPCAVASADTQRTGGGS